MKQRPILVFLLLFSACTFQVFVEKSCDTLYFGTQIPGGGEVTDAQWQQFLADVVTPRFPDGFTTWDASGQWRDQKGVIEHERTHILQIVDPRENKIREIIDAYKKQFAQEAVLRLHSQVGMSTP